MFILTFHTDIIQDQKTGKYYWHYCQPGCMPDSENFGPFSTELAAYTNMLLELVDLYFEEQKIMLTAEQIDILCADYDGRYYKTMVNRIFRILDQSNLYPISGKFNATERAIRQIRKLDSSLTGLEYCCVLESQLDRIVNQEDY